MKQYFQITLVGILFGIILTKAEVISWYRIYEMFTFESFHMFGIIGSAVALGAIVTTIIKKFKLKSIEGNEIKIAPKDFSISRYLFGGILFGIGWAMAGACPGPIYILIGNGFSVMLVVIASAILGTFVYGLVQHKLPH
ncbi:MAG: YeeE/YedE family protein [Candidatus Kapabacteria bacterium]|nr:YeeE/YedE family protein [Ignavibacteriota bacterium]MCW5884817.1 YeeE/YedE family protein [Candidatus Kapabacteria bacterium]